MSAATTKLLADLAERGITLRAADGCLACSPASALTDDLRRRLMLAKAELLVLLDRGAAYGSESAHPNAVCLSCYGTRFVRLRNGRRSVCFGCERPAAAEIAGEDLGVIGGGA